MWLLVNRIFANFFRVIVMFLMFCCRLSFHMCGTGCSSNTSFTFLHLSTFCPGLLSPLMLAVSPSNVYAWVNCVHQVQLQEYRVQCQRCWSKTFLDLGPESLFLFHEFLYSLFFGDKNSSLFFSGEDPYEYFCSKGPFSMNTERLSW